MNNLVDSKPALRFFYNSIEDILEAQDGEAIPLLRALKFCLLEEEYLCQENLDELAYMFKGFNEYQFSVMCTLLTPTLMGYEAETKGSELLKIPTRKAFSEPEKIKSLVKLYFWGVLHTATPDADVQDSVYRLYENFIDRLKAQGSRPFEEVDLRSDVGETILPDKTKKIKLFYNNSVTKSLDEIEEYLHYDNYRKLQNHFMNEGDNLCFACLLEGPSGTGKTAFVKELSRRTGRAVIFVDISKLRGKDYGHDEKMARMVFEEYMSMASIMPIGPILFVDEADTLLSSRGNPEGNANSSLINCHNTVTEIWLQELDKFNGILFLTTNNVEFIDTAIARRLLYQVHIGHPDYEIQVKLWKHYFPVLSDTEAKKIANDTNFTGGQIKSVKDKVRLKEILHGPVSFDEVAQICESNGSINKRTPVGFNR